MNFIYGLSDTEVICTQVYKQARISHKTARACRNGIRHVFPSKYQFLKLDVHTSMNAKTILFPSNSSGERCYE